VKLTEEQGRLEAEPGPRGEASWAKLRWVYIDMLPMYLVADVGFFTHTIYII
jgi:hypothetical protein